jgi:hypothetical protein
VPSSQIQIDAGWAIGIMFSMIGSLVSAIVYQNHRTDRLYEARIKEMESQIDDKNQDIAFWRSMVYDLMGTARKSNETAAVAADMASRLTPQRRG